MDEITVRPIGVVRESQFTEDGPHIKDVSGVTALIEIFEEYKPGLQGLEGEERVDVIFWLSGVGEEERRQLTLVDRQAGGVEKGVFAARRPRRPNPIGITRVELCRLDGGILEVKGLDAYPGTPVLDLKPARDKIRSGARIT